MKMTSFNESPNISEDMAAMAEPTSLMEFTLFPNLPTEIRFMILHLSLQDRVIEIHCRSRFRRYFFTETRVPAILHLNREYRKEGLTIYKLLESSYKDTKSLPFDFWTDVEAAKVLKTSRTSTERSAASSKVTESSLKFVFQTFRTYINYSKDVIYLYEKHSYGIAGHKACINLLTQSTGSNLIQTIALQPEFFGYSHPRRGYTKESLAHGKELSKLISLRKVVIVNSRQGSRCCASHTEFFLKEHSAAVEILGAKEYMSKSKSKSENKIEYEDTEEAKSCREFFHQVYKTAVIAHNSAILDPKDRTYLRFDESSYQPQGTDLESDTKIFRGLRFKDHVITYPMDTGVYDMICYARSGYGRKSGIYAVPSKIFGMPHVVPGTIVRR